MYLIASENPNNKNKQIASVQNQLSNLDWMSQLTTEYQND